MGEVFEFRMATQRNDGGAAVAFLRAVEKIVGTWISVRQTKNYLKVKERAIRVRGRYSDNTGEVYLRRLAVASK